MSEKEYQITKCGTNKNEAAYVQPPENIGLARAVCAFVSFVRHDIFTLWTSSLFIVHLSVNPNLRNAWRYPTGTETPQR